MKNLIFSSFFFIFFSLSVEANNQIVKVINTCFLESNEQDIKLISIGKINGMTAMYL